MRQQFLWASVLALMLLASCSSKKDIVYLQDMRVGTRYPIETKYEPVIHGDDLLGITVMVRATVAKVATVLMSTGISTSPSSASCTWRE